MMTQFLFFM